MPVATARLDDIPALAVSRPMRQGSNGAKSVLMRGRDAPVFSGTIHVTASGQLIALAESTAERSSPSACSNLAGVHGRAGPIRSV